MSPLERCRKYLDKMEPAIQGQGGRQRTWNAMLAVAGFDPELTQAEAWGVALDYNARCVPPWSERDLEGMLRDAYDKGRLRGRFVDGGGRGAFMPRVNRPQRQEIVVQPAQPVPVPEDALDPADTLLRLFSPDERLRACVRAMQKDGKWVPADRGDFMPAHELARQIREARTGADPAAGAWMGSNPQREGSTGTAEGVACFRYLIAEGDGISLEEQWGGILASGLPVSAVVHSGGKSLHAWVRLDAATDEEWRARAAVVRRVLLPLGFDGATMKQPGQMTRMPGVRRGDQVQRVVALGVGAPSWDAWEAQQPPETEGGQQGEAEPAPWPFICLGYDETRFHFLPHDTGRPVAIQASDLTSKAKLLGLHTDGGWWASAFPNADEKNKGADYSRAGQELRARCVAAGYWDASRQGQMRGRGIWQDGGSVVFNPGRRAGLLVDGMPAPDDWISPERKHYLSGAPLEIADEPLTDDEAADFVRLLQAQGCGGASEVVAGWTFNALCVGVVDLRAHLYLTGRKGAGKSHATEWVQRACGGFMLSVTIGTTEAALRQLMGAENAALPFCYDESESDGEKGRERMQEVLDLLRVSGEGDGQAVAKGTPGGAARSFRMRTTGLLASIHSTLERDRDRSRFVVVEIEGMEGAAADERKRETARLAARTVDRPDFAPRLARRAVMLAPTLSANAAKLRAALGERLKDERARKLWGWLLAGVQAMRHARVLTDDEAARIAAGFDPSPFSGEQDDEGDALLARILTSKVHDGTRDATIGELIVGVRGAGRDDAAGVLARYGIARDFDPGAGVRVLVNNAELLRLLRDEPWQGNTKRVRNILKAIPGAVAKPSMRVGAHKGAAVVVPFDALARHLPDLKPDPDPF